MNWPGGLRVALLLPIVTLVGCGEKAPVEPPVQMGQVRRLTHGEATHKGAPVRLDFAPASPFAPVPLLRARTPEGADLVLYLRVRVPGCRRVADLAGPPRRVEGTLRFRLAGQKEFEAKAVELEVEILDTAPPLPRCRITLRDTAAGFLTVLEGPVTTLDGTLVFQEPR